MNANKRELKGQGEHVLAMLTESPVHRKDCFSLFAFIRVHLRLILFFLSVGLVLHVLLNSTREFGCVSIRESFFLFTDGHRLRRDRFQMPTTRRCFRSK